MNVRQLTVVSGKGGTGKTTVVAAFATLARGAVLADCDVDAADQKRFFDFFGEKPFATQLLERFVLGDQLCVVAGRGDDHDLKRVLGQIKGPHKASTGLIGLRKGQR